MFATCQSCDYSVMVKKEEPVKKLMTSNRAIKNARRSIGERNLCLLKTLCHLKKNQRTVFLRAADNKLIKCIQECIFNTLKGNVPLCCSDKKRLAKHKTVLRRVAAKQGNWKIKRKLLVQRGGFLPYLIGPLLGAILSRFIGE